jgi:hypothetical protein
LLSDTKNTPHSTVSDALRAHANARPSEAEYAMIGRIALNHTGLEYQLECLVWLYMGDVDIGHVATSQMTTVEILKALETLVDWREPDDVVADEIEWSISAFNILRVNRNSIIHGFNFKADNSIEKLFIERRTRSIVFDSFDQFELTKHSFMQVINDQNNLADHLYFIQRHLERRGGFEVHLPPNAPSEPATLRPRPQLPHALQPIDRESAKSTRRLRRSLAESEARAAKARRKDQQRLIGKAQ